MHYNTSVVDASLSFYLPDRRCAPPYNSHSQLQEPFFGVVCVCVYYIESSKLLSHFFLRKFTRASTLHSWTDSGAYFDLPATPAAISGAPRLPDCVLMQT